jgi:hypothetical protein
VTRTNMKAAIAALAAALVTVPCLGWAEAAEAASCPYYSENDPEHAHTLQLRSLACRHWLRAERAEAHLERVYARRIPLWLATRIQRNRLRAKALVEQLPKSSVPPCPAAPPPAAPPPASATDAPPAVEAS